MIRTLACALLLAAPAAADGSSSHRAPAESLSRRPAAVDERRETLSEMWQRGLLSTDMNQWSPEDMALLRRLRQAEAEGALGLLRRRFRTLAGFVIKDRPPGLQRTRVRLTRLGFERYLQYKSQEALEYFESKEVEAKWAYFLTDLQGRALFDRGSGQLTQAGDDLYSQALLSRPSFWRLRTGEVRGNRPVPPELQSAPVYVPVSPPARGERITPAGTSRPGATPARPVVVPAVQGVAVSTSARG